MHKSPDGITDIPTLAYRTNYVQGSDPALFWVEQEGLSGLVTRDGNWLIKGDSLQYFYKKDGWSEVFDLESRQYKLFNSSGDIYDLPEGMAPFRFMEGKVWEMSQKDSAGSTKYMLYDLDNGIVLDDYEGITKLAPGRYWIERREAGCIYSVASLAGPDFGTIAVKPDIELVEATASLYKVRFRINPYNYDYNGFRHMEYHMDLDTGEELRCIMEGESCPEHGTGFQHQNLNR